MKQTPANPKRFAVLALGLLLPVRLLLAQEAASASKKLDDDVVTLSTYVVNADSEEG